jgi:excisionase family DNA binding protein
MAKLLSIDELSDMLGVTKATIYSWTCKKMIPHIKLSKKVLKFREEEILAWIESRSVCTADIPVPAETRKRSKTKKVSTPAIGTASFVDRILNNAKKEVLDSGS